MNARRGFSLLELILAIGLSIALVTLLGMAINLHLVRLDDSQSTVEQAQVARAVLDRIAADLRGATLAPSQDVSELMQAAEASAQFDIDEVDEQAEADDSASDLAAGAEAPPGVNGTADSVTIDRRWFGMTLATTTPGVPPAARAESAWAQVVYGMSTDRATRGLVRVETSRDAALYRVEQGQPQPVVEPIAPEVLSVAFTYYDADQQSYEVWDMAERQALPVAIEVRMQLQPADDTEDTSVPLQRRKPRWYRRLVRLPAAADEAPTESGAGSSSDGAEV